MIKGLLEERPIPDVMRLKRGRAVKNVKDHALGREETKTLLQNHEYGVIPPRPDHLSAELVKEAPNFAAGKAQLCEMKMNCTVGEKEFSFPFSELKPKSAGKDNRVPTFIFINFRPEVPDKYFPAEEIVDRGYAVLSFFYKDVASDDNSFKNGIARHLVSSRRAGNATSKIALWAWAAMRLMDYAETLDYVDLDNIAVIGHSRLGKTALVTGGFDERFKYVISNDSGCSGAAITRGKIGEQKSDICERFPFWFCPNYLNKYKSAEELPYDQHFLLALTAPRHLLIGSAELDSWADPKSEYLSLYAVKPVYNLYGLGGIPESDSVPQPKSVIYGDHCFYQLRHGTHYLSREDWNEYMNYIDKCIGR